MCRRFFCGFCLAFFRSAVSARGLLQLIFSDHASQHRSICFPVIGKIFHILCIISYGRLTGEKCFRDAVQVVCAVPLEIPSVFCAQDRKQVDPVQVDFFSVGVRVILAGPLHGLCRHIKIHPFYVFLLLRAGIRPGIGSRIRARIQAGIRIRRSIRFFFADHYGTVYVFQMTRILCRDIRAGLLRLVRKVRVPYLTDSQNSRTYGKCRRFYSDRCLDSSIIPHPSAPLVVGSAIAYAKKIHRITRSFFKLIDEP